jgi:tetratricopeptide (TPR) repeat protein
MKRILAAAAAIAILGATAAFAADTSPQAASKKPEYQQLYDGLGDVHHKVTTSSELAQKYFDQGLAFDYGFNHDEAYRSFAAAAQIDPKMAMADWGIALVLGPNYNLPGNDERMKIAYDAIKRAQSLEAGATPEERDLIEALAKRYGPDGKQTPEREQAYADAMRPVAHKYSSDPDVQALFAESLMDLHPWQLWTADGQPAKNTAEIVATLENALKQHPDHIGANHYYIHAVEASPHPERALASAHRLGKLAPAQGHLVHMPSHIYIRTGMYHEASLTNQAAIHADQEFLAKSHETGTYPMMYATHNVQFLWYAEMMEGRGRDAIASARQIKDMIPAAVVKEMPMAESLWPAPYWTLARFGQWDQILAEPAPPKDFAFTTGMWHYARGLALAAKGKPEQARAEKKALDASTQAVPADLEAGPNNRARDLMKIASSLLAGSIARANGDHQQAIRDFTDAVKQQDALGYDEPPSWYYPTRETLGAEMLAAAENKDAEEVFRTDLKKNPDNPRSLHGLAQALRAEGKAAEAAAIEERFTKAWSHADAPLAPVKVAIAAGK